MNICKTLPRRRRLVFAPAAVISGLLLAAVAACGQSPRATGTPCRCIGSAEGVDIDVACGETFCVGTGQYRCTGPNSVSAEGSCGSSPVTDAAVEPPGDGGWPPLTCGPGTHLEGDACIPDYRYDDFDDHPEDFVLSGACWPTPTITYCFDSFTSDVSHADARAAIRAAFDTWAAAAPLTFTETLTCPSAQIRFLWATGIHAGAPDPPFDGAGNVLAHAYQPGAGIGGDAHFCDDETWTTAPQTTGAQPIDLQTVALHEIGHALGLRHTTVPTAVMFAIYSGSRRALDPDDIAGIQSCYGGHCMSSCPMCRTTDQPDGCGGTCPSNCSGTCAGNTCVTCTPSCPSSCRTSAVPDGCDGTCPSNCSGACTAGRCVVCGDGTCDEGENGCNCLVDCHGEACGCGDGCSTTYTSWSSCGGFSSTCETTGAQTRTRTDRTCRAGACDPTDGTESQSCTRSTTGVTCGTTTYSAWGTCGGFSSACDTTGTQSRTRTDYRCSGGGCAATTSTETQSCTRTVPSSTVVARLYTNDAYETLCTTLTCGTLSISNLGSGCGDKISSVDLVAAASVRLYWDSGFGGCSVLLTSDCPDLRWCGACGTRTDIEDRASSVRATP